MRNKRVYVYNEGDVTYQNRNLKADYMQIDMDTKLIYAYGKPDSVDGKWTVTKPEFTEAERPTRWIRSPTTSTRRRPRSRA